MKVSKNGNNWDIRIIMLNNLINIYGIGRKLVDIEELSKLYKTLQTQYVGSTKCVGIFVLSLILYIPHKNIF